MKEKTIYYLFLETFRSYKEGIEGIENEDNNDVKDLENELEFKKIRMKLNIKYN